MKAYVAWIALLFASLGWPCIAHGEEPVTVSVCAVAAAPLDFDRHVIQVEGTLDHGFENFTISDPACPGQKFWLAYGGTPGSETVYCCGNTAEREYKEPLTVDGIVTQLRDDKTFRHLDRILHSAGSVKVRVTLEGHFFARKPVGNGFDGYGHFGVFSLLVIERVHAATRLSHSS